MHFTSLNSIFRSCQALLLNNTTPLLKGTFCISNASIQETLATRALISLRSFGQACNPQIAATSLKGQTCPLPHIPSGLRTECVQGHAKASLHTQSYARSWQSESRLAEHARSSLSQQTGTCAQKQPPSWHHRAAVMRSYCSQSAQKAPASVKPASSSANVLVQRGSSAARSLQNTVKGAGSTAYKVLPSQAKQLIDSAVKPGAVQKAISLQLEAFWQRHSRKVIGAGAVFLLYFLWKTLFNVTSVFVNLSETMAEFGFLALAAAMVAFGFLYLRHLYTISPDAVYRKALIQLNTNPGILEVMGAPVAGSDVRAYVMTGGGLRLKNLRPSIRSRRVQMIFPLTGTERRGLVSLEAKKRKGAYVFKLLALDVPSAAGPEQRIYLEGDEKIYNRGSVIRELRDPFLNALSMRETYEAEDELDDAADDAHEAQERRSRNALRATPGSDSQGMYFHERVYWAIRRWLAPRVQQEKQQAQ